MVMSEEFLAMILEMEEIEHESSRKEMARKRRANKEKDAIRKSRVKAKKLRRRALVEGGELMAVLKSALATIKENCSKESYYDFLEQCEDIASKKAIVTTAVYELWRECQVYVKVICENDAEYIFRYDITDEEWYRAYHPEMEFQD